MIKKIKSMAIFFTVVFTFSSVSSIEPFGYKEDPPDPIVQNNIF